MSLKGLTLAGAVALEACSPATKPHDNGEWACYGFQKDADDCYSRAPGEIEVKIAQSDSIKLSTETIRTYVEAAVGAWGLSLEEEKADIWFSEDIEELDESCSTVFDMNDARLEESYYGAIVVCSLDSTTWTDEHKLGQDTAAYTNNAFNNDDRELTASTIVIDPNIEKKLTGNTSQVEGAITHELGHALGLAHSTDADTVMYPDTANLNKPGSGDKEGLVALYGTKQEK